MKNDIGFYDKKMFIYARSSITPLQSLHGGSLDIALTIPKFFGHYKIKIFLLRKSLSGKISSE